MAAYWLPIAVQHCNFAELEQRHVVAQGWADLGDMTDFIHQHQNVPDHERLVAITALIQQHYTDAQETLPGRLTNFFFNLQPGDIFVAIEGIAVRGICSLCIPLQYEYNPNYEYAHTWGPVNWIDWETVSPDWRPHPPALGVLALAQIRNDHDRVVEVFRRYLQQN